MLKMIEGCRIHDPSLLQQGYEKIETGFVANVDADKIQSLFENFIKLHNKPCFVILEVPTNLKEEPDYPFGQHEDVYYLDNLSPERGIEFLQVFGRWLIHDGLSTFGIGIHSGSNEMLKEMYNVVSVYTKDPLLYHGFFESHGIPKVNHMKTAWDYFTDSTPGDSFRYTYKGTDIYGLIEHLKKYGLYFAERREK